MFLIYITYTSFWFRSRLILHILHVANIPELDSVVMAEAGNEVALAAASLDLLDRHLTLMVPNLGYIKLLVYSTNNKNY